MKTLFLIRHAKSSWKDVTIDDHDRPLNKRGKENAPMMGDRLKKRQIMPDLIFSSTALRAKATANCIGKKINFPIIKITFLRELYHASPNRLFDSISQAPDQAGSIMFFGHNPGLTELAVNQWNIPILNLPTCGILEIQFKSDSWKLVGKERISLTTFDYPKNPSPEGITLNLK